MLAGRDYNPVITGQIIYETAGIALFHADSQVFEVQAVNQRSECRILDGAAPQPEFGLGCRGICQSAVIGAENEQEIVAGDLRGKSGLKEGVQFCQTTP